MSLLLDIANDNQAPARARAWLASNCGELEAAMRMRAEVGLVEAINNAVAYRSEPIPGRIRVRLYRGHTIWVFQVRDTNRSAALALSDAIPDPEQTGGRGWYIIRQSATEARYRRHGDRNVVTIALQPRQRPTSPAPRAPNVSN